MKGRRIAIPLVVAGVSLALSWKWWATRFLWTADGRLHLLRIYELDRALLQGIPYPRWAPDLYFGYGYPVFNFYPTLAYYIAETFHVVGLDLLAALKSVLALSFVLAGLGAYLLGRELYSEILGPGRGADLAALLSGLAYSFSPYLIIDVYTRGAIAEALAMALLPFLVWAVRRTILSASWSAVAMTAIIAALFLVSHNLTAFFAVPFVAGYVVVKLVSLPDTRARAGAFGRLAVAAVIGLGLAAFYWLPGYFELPLVYVGQPAFANVPLQQRLLEHFLPVGQLIQFSWLYQYVDAPWPLSAAELILGAAGLLAVFRWLPRRLAAEPVYFALVAVVVGIAVSELARPLWLALPSLWVIQFPWRLTVFWTLALALLTGLLGVWVARQLWRPAFAIGALALLALIVIAVGAVNLKATLWDVPPLDELGVGMIARDEVSSQVPGASFFKPPIAEYLPYTATGVPFPQLGLRKTPSDASRPVPQIALEAQNSNRWVIHTNAAKSFSLTVRTFYFPDWTAEIDGKPARTYPSMDNGILTLDVPSGEHRVAITQGSSFWAQWGERATALSLVLMGILSAGIVLRRERAGFGLAVASILLLPMIALPYARAALAQRPAVTPVQVDVDSSLRLLGYSAEPSADKLLLHLYWQVKRQVPQEQPLHVQLVDAAGKVSVERTQYARFGTGWMVNWHPDEIADDLFELALPDAVQRAAYTFRLARGNEGFNDVGSITLDPPRQADPHEAMASSLGDIRLGDNIHLLGLSAPGAGTLKPGDTFRFTLYWKTDTDILQDYIVTTQLLDQEGRFAAQLDGPPDGGFAQTSLWIPGRIVSDSRELKIPANAAPGLYQLVAGMYRYPSLAHLAMSVSGQPADNDFARLMQVKLSPLPPAHPPQHPRNLQFGSAIRLQGTDVAIVDSSGKRVDGGSPDDVPILKSQAGQTMNINLIWTPSGDAGPGQDYTVFVHVVDDAGKLAGQVDNPPVGGHYPTTLWGAREIITDPYTIPLQLLAPGHYTVWAGMYSRATGTRLPIQDAQAHRLADDQFPLADLTVQE